MFDGWWANWILQDFGVAGLLSWIVVVVGSITLHELAHGWAAIPYGDTTPIHAGHMTWNPLVHLGGPSLLCFALFGICWGSMPVDSSRLRGRWSGLLVSLAGPVMNFLLAAVGMLLYGTWLAFATRWNVSEPMLSNAQFFFRAMAFLNVALGLFNLVPIYPLDGGRILGELVPAYRRLATGDNGQWVMLGAFALLFFFGAAGIFGVAFVIAEIGAELVRLALSAVF